MVFLEYHKETKQVIQIHATQPTVANDYDYAISDDFSIGDEFELTITVTIVDENKKMREHAAVRNNPNARRLLLENVQLKQDLDMQINYSLDMDFRLSKLELGI